METLVWGGRRQTMIQSYYSRLGIRKKAWLPGYQYADLPGYFSSVSIIPTNLSSKLSRPDLILVPDDYMCLF